MGAFLDDAAVVHDDDAVGGADGGQAVGDDDRGAVFHQPLERVLDQPLAFGVERGGRFVEQQQGRVRRSSARAMAMRWRWPPDRRAPPSPMKVSRPSGSARRKFSALASRAAAQISSSLGVPMAVAQVVAGRGGEDHRFLRHHGDARANVGGIGIAQVDAVEQHAAVLRIVEALGELEQGRLAGARRADDGEPSRRADGEA